MGVARERARFIGRRVAQAVPTILLIVTLNFLLVHLAPGNAADVLAGESGSATPEYMAFLRHEFGLDQPLYVQYLDYLKNVVTLDLGYSFRDAMPVRDLILQRLGPTLLLMGTTIVLSVGIGILLGLVAAGRPNSWRDNVISVFALVSYATPLFWVGLMLIVLFSIHLGWFPTSGMTNIAAFYTGWQKVGDVARHLVLPAITLSLFYMALYVRLMRASMLEQSGMDYVVTARSKGLTERAITYRHVLRNAQPADRDDGRRADRQPARRVRGRGDGVRMAGHRPARVPGAVRARPQSAARNLFRRGLPGDRRQYPGGRDLFRSRPANPAAVKQVDALEFCRRFARNRASLSGLLILVAIVVVAIAGPRLLHQESPFDLAGQPFLPPFGHYLLGTDMLGRNELAGIIYGARTSLVIGLAATLFATLLGVLVGGVAGYYGGAVDEVLMRLTEIFQTIPSFLFAILVVAILSPSIESVVIAIAIVSWPPMARLVRGEFQALRNREFVQACISMGMSDLRVILLHILPNCLSSIIVTGSLLVATAILTESALSFLGLTDPNVMSWGFMVGAARDFLQRAWWLCAIPGVAILITVLAINLVGDGLNDALNPRLRHL